MNLKQRAGEAAMTLNELKSTALSFRNSQSRMVTKADLGGKNLYNANKLWKSFPSWY